MEAERRHESRTSKKQTLSISWTDSNKITCNVDVRLVDASDAGLSLISSREIAPGTIVYATGRESSAGRYGIVRHCTKEGHDYMIGLELDVQQSATGDAAADSENYYELLQISPSAQSGTIHRVFRYLAALYHPDNPETGDPERFLLVNRAYSVLSNPDKRAAYDSELNQRSGEPNTAFAGIDFMEGVEGELNRRLAVLAVLYRKSRSNIHDCSVKLVELEQQMGFPRDYLDFTTWYLRNKKYITKEDNSDFSLTAAGVDFIEENYTKIPMLRKMLNSGRMQEFRSERSRETSGKAPLILPHPTEPEDGQSMDGFDK